jgi:hypothetical protein
MPGNLTDTAEPIALNAINNQAAGLFTDPLKLRICSAIGSESAAGTQYSGSTDQTITFASGGASSNGQSFTGLGTGDCQGWEVYDSAGTPKRIWWGLWSPVTSGVTAQNTGDTITKTAHGLANGQKIVFQPGYTPAGLTGGTTYFVVGQTANTFQVATTLGGSAVAITADSTDGQVSYGLVKVIANAGDALTVASGAITTSLD